MAPHSFDQHRLQVSAMHHPVRRPVAQRGARAEGGARQHPSGLCVHYSELFRHDHVRLQFLAQTEGKQNA